MKTHSFSSLILGIMSIFCTCDAHENFSHCFSEKEHNCFIAQTEDKIYINPEAIIIYENKIYLNITNNPVPVSSLFSDDKGIYISKKKGKDEEEKKTWTCPTCSWENPYTSPICQNTAYHRLYEPEYR